MSTQLKNVAFGDKVLKEDANGSVGNVKTGNLDVNGNLAVSGDLTVSGNLTIGDNLYLYYDGQRFLVYVDGEYNLLKVQTA